MSWNVTATLSALVARAFSSATMVWYTDPFGQNGKSTPFPGSVRQVFRGTTSGLVASAYKMGKIVVELAAPRVHAPN